jgi:SH3 domain protein
MKPLILAGLLALGVFSSALPAQTLYVSDQLVITFRTGPGSQFAISRNLNSGDRVEVLEQLEEEGYSRVRLPDGTEGWVLTRYLQPEPTAQTRLATATRELAAERQRADELEQLVARLESSLADTSTALDASQTSADQMDAELADIRAASAGALQTRQQNQELRRQLDELTTGAQVAAMEIDELRRRERQNWFIIGAAVLLGGVIIGLVAPSLRPKRRSTW